MIQRKKSRTLSRRAFVGSVELIPPAPRFIEFIDAHGLWGFPVQKLSRFVLEDNPEPQRKKTSPPDQLSLVYPGATVILRGWRLELMIGPLIGERVARVHAEKSPAPLGGEEPWVSEIRVTALNHSGLRTAQAETPVPIKHS